MDKLSAFGRGAAQGATAGWNEELVSKLLSALPNKDETGIPREYAAGSAEQDYLNTERAANAEAAQKYPLNYGAGSFLGAAPLAGATGGLGGGIAGAGLAGGALGALSGAGHADEGDRVRGAAAGAGVGALSSMAGAALPALSKLGMKAPAQAELAPAGAQINREQMVIPGSQPRYWHHNTPSENVPSISEGGLKAAEGGKNFDLAKNKGKIYFTDEGNAANWAEKVNDATGKPVAELRTTVGVKDVPGANESIKVRELDVPPHRIEMKSPSGQWKALGQTEAHASESTNSVGPAPKEYQYELPFQTRAIRPTRLPSGELDIPTIPRPGRLPSPERIAADNEAADRAVELLNKQAEKEARLGMRGAEVGTRNTQPRMKRPRPSPP